MNLKKLVSAIGLVFLAAPGSATAQDSFEVVSRSDVTFQPLNPLRGDASPKAGVLWGDIKTPGATGTLIEFKDGFSSPPHIHNITYRAVVISGEVHNDDPEAGTMWMGPGSYWSQPAGETHITAAKGSPTTAFLEILEGPYLVRPPNEAFDSGERPINMEARNVVWLDPSDVSWIESADEANGLQMAFLWGKPRDGERNGTFLRLPAGGGGILESSGDWLRAVLIKGIVIHQQPESTISARLDPGSYFGAPNGVGHELVCGPSGECLFYVTAKGRFMFSAR